MPGIRYRNWTAEEDKMLRELHAQGVSYSTIASMMGKTKSSISGRVDRLCLSRRPTIEPLPLGGVQDELTDCQCRWPIGHPGEPDFHFCNATMTSWPYCEAHRKIAYEKVRGTL